MSAHSLNFTHMKLIGKSWMRPIHGINVGPGRVASSDRKSLLFLRWYIKEYSAKPTMDTTTATRVEECMRRGADERRIRTAKDGKIWKGGAAEVRDNKNQTNKTGSILEFFSIMDTNRHGSPNSWECTSGTHSVGYDLYIVRSGMKITVAGLAPAICCSRCMLPPHTAQVSRLRRVPTIRPHPSCTQSAFRLPQKPRDAMVVWILGPFQAKPAQKQPPCQN